jgi:hypothetical protein
MRETKPKAGAMAGKVAKKKRVKLLRGDLFEFSAENGRLGYGVITIPGVAFHAAFMKTMHTARPAIDALLADDIALIGTTTDALFYHGHWAVIAHDFPLPKDIPFPNWKVGINGELRTTDFEGRRHWPMRPDELSLLDYKTSWSPGIFQKAIEALNGIGEWRESYEQLTPAYARLRVTRA